MGSLDSRLDAPFLFSWRGHYLQPDKFLDREGVINAAKKKGYRISDKPIDAVRSLRLDIEIAEQLKEQKGVTRPDRLPPYLGSCHVCGEMIYLERAVLGGENYQVSTPCAYPKGIKPFDIKLEVPSGKIVFTNDSRDLVDVKDDQDVNAIIGTVQTIKAYEAAGMVHFLVGNSCPSIYKTKGGGLRVAPYGNGKGGKRVGSICTDLWWVCATDHANYTRLCEAKGAKPELGNVVAVKPGTYAFKFDPHKGCDFQFCEARKVK
jgi:hypothetical protein